MPQLPAEWAPQRALLLTWPHPRTDWAAQLESVEAVYLALVRAVTCHQPVVILCPDASWRARVESKRVEAGLSDRPVFYALAPSNDTWTRDHGPIGVLDDRGQAVLVDFRFNGWGGKYPAALDDGINQQLSTSGLFGATRWQHSPLVLEGGAIDSDGQGSLLIMRRTVVDPARNPGWTQPMIEQELSGQLGTRHFLWLEHGQLSGDDTDGHIDTLARFVAAGTIVHVTCEDPQDPDAEAIAAMIAELRALRDAQGRPYRLCPLPCPAPIYDQDGQRLPAGYANFALINDAVLLPVYQDPADTQAIALLRDCFPERRLYPIDCRALIRQGGSLHCACMQLPAAVELCAHVD